MNFSVKSVDEARRRARIPKAQEVFEAYTNCPHCGEIDLHWMREPRVLGNADMPVAVLSQLEKYALMTGLNTIPTRLEANFDVIRICRKCKGEWGQS